MGTIELWALSWCQQHCHGISSKPSNWSWLEKALTLPVDYSYAKVSISLGVGFITGQLDCETQCCWHMKRGRHSLLLIWLPNKTSKLLHTAVWNSTLKDKLGVLIPPVATHENFKLLYFNDFFQSIMNNKLHSYSKYRQ